MESAIAREYNAAEQLLARNAGRADKVAYVDDTGSCTYGELTKRVGRFASALQRMGVRPEERVLIAMQAAGAKAGEAVDIFVVHSGEAAQREAWRLAERWRDSGRNVVLGAGGSFKSQMKKADASGARFAVIIGDDEVAARTVTLKPLRGGGEQKTLAPDEALALVG